MSVTNEEWAAFLDNIAVQVDQLLLQPEALAIFRQKIQAFKQRWEKHCDESDRRAQAKFRHWEAVKNNARLRDKAAGPPEGGWEWDCHYVADVGPHIATGAEYEIPPEHAQGVIVAVEREIERTKARMAECHNSCGEYRGLADYLPVIEQDLADLHAEWDRLSPVEKTKTWIKAPRRCLRNGPSKDIAAFMWFRLVNVDEREVFGCWRPPLKEIPENPCSRFSPEHATGKLPPSRDRAEEYERYYVSLASIHDHRLPGSQSITDGVWPHELAESVWFRFSRGPAVGPDGAFITTALNRVRAELENFVQRPNGPGQAGETAGDTLGVHSFITYWYPGDPPVGRDLRLGGMTR